MQDKKPVILIVDDALDNTMIAKRILERNGYTTLTASSGEEALSVVFMQHVDLVLLDIMMPKMDGFETCRQLKQDPRSAEIPVIFLTALTDAESFEEAVAIGGLDYIVKPVKRPELLARVKMHLELDSLHKFLDHVGQCVLESPNSAQVVRYENPGDLNRRAAACVQVPLFEMRSVLEALQSELEASANPETRESLARIEQLRTHALDEIEKLFSLTVERRKAEKNS